MSKFNKTNDPATFAAMVHTTCPGLPKDYVLALGLDLGSSTGYAYTWLPPRTVFDPEKHPVFIGQLDLSAGPYDSGAIRFVRLRHFLGLLRPQCVFMEDVKYTPPDLGRQPAAVIMARAALPCEFFGALKGQVAGWCEENDVPEQPIPIGTIKKRATNKGNASKEAVVASTNAVLKLGLTQDMIDDCKTTGLDNSCDAFWAMVVGLENHWMGLNVENCGAVPLQPVSQAVVRRHIDADPADELQASPRTRRAVRPVAGDGVDR